MLLTGLARLGRDAVLRNAGDSQVLGLSLAMNYGRRGEDGNRQTQWIDAALWGTRAEKLEQHMTSGKLLYVVLEDVHIEEFTDRDGATRSKLAARVVDVEFAGSSGGADRGDGQRQAAQPRQAQPQRSAPPPRAAAPSRPAGPPDSDIDDDIPF